MKILLLAPQPFFRVRGTPINIRNLAAALALAGHRVDLLCYPFGETPDLPGVRILRSPPCPGIRDVKVGPSLAKVPLDGLMFLKALGLCRRERYDVLHAVEESVFFAVLLKALFRTRLVYDMDSCISDQLEYSGFIRWKFLLRAVEALERWAIRRSDFVLTVCRSLTETVHRLVPGARVEQIEDAPLEDSFIPDAAAADSLSARYQLGGHPVILYTGNFETYQGVGVLINALPEILRAQPAARLLLVGGEPDQVSDMEQLAAKLGMDTFCRFAGKRPMSEMPSFLTLASVLVSPRTRGENTALKIYGYMQSGVPIVATDLPTHTQVLDEDCAVLVESTAPGLAGGILQVLRDPAASRNLGAEAQARVASRYSLSRFRSRVEESYKPFISS